MPAIFVGSLLRGQGWWFDGRALLLMYAIYLPFVYAAALVFGLPLHLWLRRTGHGAAWIYAVAGGTIAFGIGLIPVLGDFATASDRAMLFLAGALVGFAFRTIVGPGPGPSPPRADAGA